MRRALILPLIAALAVAAMLGPAGALGPFSGGPKPSTSEAVDPSPPPVGAPAPTSTSTTTTSVRDSTGGAITVAPARPAPTATVADAAPSGDRVSDVGEIDRPALRLACEPVVGDGVSGVVCEWSTLDSARGYRLWRAVDPGSGSAREVIATVAAGEPPRHVDREIRPGHRYVYAVEAIAADGSTLALSEPVQVAIDGPRDVRVRLGCAAGVTDAGRGIVCEWSAVDAEAAAGYVLWRSVGDAEREVIARSGLDGRTRYLDQDVSAGMAYTYVVQVVDAAGEPLAISEPATVRLPERARSCGCGLGCEAVVTEAGGSPVSGRRSIEAAAGYVLWRRSVTRA